MHAWRSWWWSCPPRVHFASKQQRSNGTAALAALAWLIPARPAAWLMVPARAAQVTPLPGVLSSIVPRLVELGADAFLSCELKDQNNWLTDAIIASGYYLKVLEPAMHSHGTDLWPDPCVAVWLHAFTGVRMQAGRSTPPRRPGRLMCSSTHRAAHRSARLSGHPSIHPSITECACACVHAGRVHDLGAVFQ